MRIVVTLTGEGGRQLAQWAQAAGWSVTLWPGLTFTGVPAGERDALCGADLGWADWAVVTSPQGARCLLAALARLDAPWPERVAAVGRGTAQPLTDAGVAVHWQPHRADAAALAQGLPAGQGAHVLHLTGEAASDTLERGLLARGMHYRRRVLYRAQAAVVPPGLRAAFRQADRVVVASGVVAAGLAEQLGTDLRLLAMGEQTGRAAVQAGFGEVAVAGEPSLEGLWHSLCRQAGQKSPS